MIDQLGESQYFQWSKIKSQPIPITTIKSKWSFLVKSAFPDSVWWWSHVHVCLFLDGSYRGKKLINLKEISDEAIGMCKEEWVLIVNNHQWRGWFMVL